MSARTSMDGDGAEGHAAGVQRGQGEWRDVGLTIAGALVGALVVGIVTRTWTGVVVVAGFVISAPFAVRYRRRRVRGQRR